MCLISDSKNLNFQIDEFNIWPMKITAQSRLKFIISILKILLQEHGKTVNKAYMENINILNKVATHNAHIKRTEIGRHFCALCFCKNDELFMFRLNCLLYARDQFENSDNTST